MTPKDKLQEAAEAQSVDYIDSHKQSFNDGFIAGANYASTQHKEEIEELVSALETLVKHFSGEVSKTDANPMRTVKSLIQKHRK